MAKASGRALASIVLCWFLACAALVAACGGGGRDFKPNKSGSGPNGSNGGGDFADGGEILSGSITLEPADVTLDVSSGPASQKYRVILTTQAGSKIDVTDRAAFAEEGADVGHTLGTFQGATFNAAGDRVGKTFITAKVDAVMGKTSLSIHAKRTLFAKGADPQAAAKFAVPDAQGSSAAIVYPDDGVVVPPNMNELEIHFVPQPGQSLFELSFGSPYLELVVYLGCNALNEGCSYAPDKEVWNLVSSAGRGNDAIPYRLRAYSNGAVTRSPERHIGFARENITGGLYYWNAGAGQTKRYEFGVSGQQAETFLSAQMAGSIFCVGCHAISRDGRFIAVGLDIPGTSAKTLTVATRQQLFVQQGASFFAFSPDGNEIMTSNGASIVWRNTANGSVIKDPVVPQGTMPDWSADGASLVYAKSKELMFAAPAISKGEIEVVKKNGSGWGAPTTLVARTGAENNYYPAFSPDSEWVAFNRSPSGIGSMGESSDSSNPSGVKDGQIWIVKASGGAPQRLTAVATGADAYDSWPKWAPMVQSYRGKKLMWLTFSSKRAYGLRTVAGGQTQLWMAAFDPESGAADPSVPAFWLPFQELLSGNHIAQWVTRVERQPCGGPGTCAAGESCVEGRCVPLVK